MYPRTLSGLLALSLLVVELDTWNGATFVANTDYHSNIVSVPDATNHTDTTLANAATTVDRWGSSARVVSKPVRVY